MVRIVMRPVKSPVVKGEGLYAADFNGKLLMHVRAKNAAHAERKLMFCFTRELTGKTLDFRLEDFENDGSNKDVAEAPADLNSASPD